MEVTNDKKCDTKDLRPLHPFLSAVVGNDKNIFNVSSFVVVLDLISEVPEPFISQLMNYRQIAVNPHKSRPRNDHTNPI